MVIYIIASGKYVTNNQTTKKITILKITCDNLHLNM